MDKRAPSTAKLLLAGAFTLSCFGLLLFLWVSFGGPVPFKPKSYQVTVPFEEATQLAVESDVRISGVSVGKVKQIELSGENRADATLEIEATYAPIPGNTRAMLRQKTLLGETYVELTPGDPGSGAIPEGGSLPAAQVSDAVQLDEIFRTFDEPTRLAFQSWMQGASASVRGRGADLNAALGNLTPFVARADDLLRILDGQRAAVGRLVRDGGATFDALSERQGALRSLILNSERVFETTAARDEQLREAFRALPTFLAESEAMLRRTERFAVDTDPLITQLRPAARELSGTLRSLQVLAPEMEGFFNGLGPVTRHARSGLGALRTVLDDELPAPLARIDSYLNELIPIVQVVRAYRRETTAFLGNVSAATNGFNVPSEGGGSRSVRYVRSTGPLGPEVLSSLPRRLRGSRTNAYVKPGGYTRLRQGLDSFLTAHCGPAGLSMTLNPADAAALPGDLFERIQRYAFGGAGNLSSDNVPAPPCRKQPPFTTIGGAAPQQRDFFQVRAQP